MTIRAHSGEIYESIRRLISTYYVSTIIIIIC